MKTFRAIIIGIGIWAAGVSLFTLSHAMPVLENVELQANLALLVSIPLLVWFGSQLYYKKDAQTHGFKLGLLFVFIAAVLDALITVPFLLASEGVTHFIFFTDPGFWLIALLFVVIAVSYYYRKIHSQMQTLKN